MLRDRLNSLDKDRTVNIVLRGVEDLPASVMTMPAAPGTATPVQQTTNSWNLRDVHISADDPGEMMMQLSRLHARSRMTGRRR